MLFFAILSVLSAFFCLPLHGAENEVLSFGAAEGFHFVIAVPQNNRAPDSAHFSRTRALLQEREEAGRLPEAKISLVLTKNDYSRLPADLRPQIPEGAEAVISMLNQDRAGAVLLVLPEESPGVTTVKCGVRGATTPPELLSALVRALEESGENWRLEESNLELYRIGWMPEHHILAAYLNAGIPAAAVCTSADIPEVLLRTAEFLAEAEDGENGGIRISNDSHYMLLPVLPAARDAFQEAARLHGKPGMRGFFVVNEGLLVAAVVCGFSVFLFYLCLFSFLRPQTRRRRRRELMLVLPYPFLYAALNIIALYAGEKAAAFLFFLRFGKSDAWILLPRTAFFMKLSITFLLTASFSALKNYLLFPRSQQMLGYIAALSSFVNIFVFSALEFSLAPYFSICFLFALACVYSKNRILQGVLTVLFTAVFFHFYRQILAGNTAAISALYNGENGWNIWAAFFAVPIQLMISRIIVQAMSPGRNAKRPRIARAMLSAKFLLKRKDGSGAAAKIRIPVFPVCALILTLSCASVIFFSPGWSEENPLRLTVSQSITEEESGVRISGAAEPGEIRLKETRNENFPAFEEAAPEDFLSADFSSSFFLDRSVFELTVTPKIAASRIDVLISAPEGIAVHTASLPFTFEEGGASALFVTRENPDIPLRLNFITGTAGTLFAEISFWSVENPYGLHTDERDIATNHLLFVRRKILLREGN